MWGKGLAGTKWHLSIESYSSIDVGLGKGFPLSVFPSYFSITWSMNDSEANVFVANTHSFFMTVLSWKPSPVPRGPAESPLDFHHWVDEVPCWHVFLTCPDAWIHKLWMQHWWTPCFLWWHFPRTVRCEKCQSCSWASHHHLLLWIKGWGYFTTVLHVCCSNRSDNTQHNTPQYKCMCITNYTEDDRWHPALIRIIIEIITFGHVIVITSGTAWTRHTGCTWSCLLQE